MSEKQCNKCSVGQIVETRILRGILQAANYLCNTCILKSNFIHSYKGVHIVHPPVKDDRF